jgi:exodeoxyribonuclease-5
MELSPGQAKGLDAFKVWRQNRKRPFFYLGGYAGTGKTTIAKKITEDEENPIFGAYTGKAASVLNKKGIPAQTIHSMIYKILPADEARVKELKEYLEKATTDEERKQIKEELKEVYKPRFELDKDSVVRDASLIVIDEVSMVGPEIGQDLLSFGVPVLVLGDPGQLPPVSGEGYFTSQSPDFLLTEIHRQAAGNPIIGMATVVRQGGRLKAGLHGDSEVIWKNRFNEERYREFDQVICGRNATRRAVNGRIRDQLNHTGATPDEGEKIICLRNNKEHGILNGTQWSVHSCQDYGFYLELEIKPDDFGPDTKPIQLDTHPFDLDLNDLPPYARRKFEEFDFGYAITCHKSQGSQWKKVLIHNEAFCFRENSAKWLYTALTRAEEKVLVIL